MVHQWLTGANSGDGPKAMAKAIRHLEPGVSPFHWELEFPEIFYRDNPGFDTIVGNPPFAGKNTLVSGNHEYYLDWLKNIHEETHGNSDLVAHFYRRSFSLLRNDGSFGLIATNTISQGDTRGTGLRWICNHSGTIFSAIKRYKWPGQAAVIVSIVWIYKGIYASQMDLDGLLVDKITAYLLRNGGNDNPIALQLNSNKCFEGVKVYGSGFIFDDFNSDGSTSPIADMRRLVDSNIENTKRIFKYVGGQEVNDHPSHENHRFVIDFGSIPLERTSGLGSWKEATDRQRQNWLRTGSVPLDYLGKVASDWPDLLQIVEAKVKPQRDGDNREQYRRLWWQFGEKRAALNIELPKHSSVLVCSRVQPHWAITIVPNGTVFSDSLDVFCVPSLSSFCVLQSNIHEVWVRLMASSMKDDLRYTPSECFETFPFPERYESRLDLERQGETYFTHRANLMVQNQQGLTATYNRFHDAEERDSGVLQLRILHKAMDEAVLRAYGWEDLDLAYDFFPDFEPSEDEDGEPTRTRIRYRWPNELREEVLARLLALNAQRAEEERLQVTFTEVEPIEAFEPPNKRGRKPKAPLPMAAETPSLFSHEIGDAQ
jgi:hypothetical protein